MTTQLKKALWLLCGLTEKTESILSRRIGEEEATQAVLGMWIALSELKALIEKLNRLDGLDTDCPKHQQNWRPYPEV